MCRYKVLLAITIYGCANHQQQAEATLDNNRQRLRVQPGADPEPIEKEGEICVGSTANVRFLWLLA